MPVFHLDVCNLGLLPRSWINPGLVLGVSEQSLLVPSSAALPLSDFLYAYLPLPSPIWACVFSLRFWNCVGADFSPCADLLAALDAMA